MDVANALKEQSPYPEECGEIIYHNKKDPKTSKLNGGAKKKSKKPKISEELPTSEGFREEPVRPEIHNTYR
jgi:hypothetical protein